MTTTHLPERNSRHCLIGQTLAVPARALGRECHVKPATSTARPQAGNTFIAPHVLMLLGE